MIPSSEFLVQPSFIPLSNVGRKCLCLQVPSIINDSVVFFLPIGAERTLEQMCISYSIYSLLFVPFAVFFNSVALLVFHSQVPHHCLVFLLKYKSCRAPKADFDSETL